LILFTEHLDKYPAQTIDTVHHFLGLSNNHVPNNLGKKYNTGGENVINKNILNRISQVSLFKSLWHLVPVEKRKTFYLWFYNEVNSKSMKREMDAESRQLLINYYQEDVFNLQDLLSVTVPWKNFNKSVKGV
jgi:hypothetical protein